MKQAPCGSQRHSEAQSHGRLEIGGRLVRRALSRTRRRWCISAAKSRDHCMYHGSSSAACSGGNKIAHAWHGLSLSFAFFSGGLMVFVVAACKRLSRGLCLRDRQDSLVSRWHQFPYLIFTDFFSFPL